MDVGGVDSMAHVPFALEGWASTGHHLDAQPVSFLAIGDEVGEVQIFTLAIEKQSAESVLGGAKRSAAAVARERAKAQARLNGGGGEVREWVVNFTPHCRVQAHAGWVSRIIFVPEIDALISSSEDDTLAGESSRAPLRAGRAFSSLSVRFCAPDSALTSRRRPAVVGVRNLHDAEESRRLTHKLMQDDGAASHLRPGIGAPEWWTAAADASAAACAARRFTRRLPRWWWWWWWLWLWPVSDRPPVWSAPRVCPGTLVAACRQDRLVEGESPANSPTPQLPHQPAHSPPEL